MKKFVFGLAALAANAALAAPLVSSNRPASASASQEALLLRQYTRVVAEDLRQARAVIENGAGEISLTQLLGEPPRVPGAAQDPREFGFDPERTWRGIRTADRPNANQISPLAGQPSYSPRRSVASEGGAGEGSIAGRVRSYFTRAARAVYNYTGDPLSMTLGPSLGGVSGSLMSARTPALRGSRGGQSAAAVNLTHDLDARSDYPFTGESHGATRRDIVADLGGLVGVRPKGARSNNGAGGQQDWVAYDESENISLSEFADRVLSAILTTPWLYLGLGFFGLARLVAVGMRRQNR